ncbi:response regulator [Motiliproteus sp. SC1-56]|uniref:response regulator n=1 Tax=Motiliproteus sp. SC1-56 TaxID=2799565 RepID=UPI001A8E828C|nr:response regulator [Motiliproteus sp. SC1-56]
MTGKKVLVVDDAATVRQAVRAAVTAEGHEVVEASNGKEAIKKLQAQRISLMITDIDLAAVDGITLTRSVKRVSSYQSLPVVFLTAEDAQTFLTQAKEAGACAWIDKPFTQAEIQGVVRSLLR